MTTLYTSGNTNLRTVGLVAHAVSEQVNRDGSPQVKKLVLFSSAQASTPALKAKEDEVYHGKFGSEVRIERVPLSGKGLARPEDIAAVFGASGTKYVDLTNGQKVTTAQLYLAASLLHIDNIYSASLLVDPSGMSNPPREGVEFLYVSVPRFANLHDLSKLSYFDLIFYMEQIEAIFAEPASGRFLSDMRRDLVSAVADYCRDNNLRNAASSSTTSVEVFIKELLAFLRSYPFAVTFANHLGMALDKQKDPLGAITYFFRLYSEHGSQASPPVRDPELEALLTLPGLLSPLRMFRNLSAHSGASCHIFRPHEVRICINLALEAFRCARASTEFWRRLVSR
jgi:hypothetical protein